MHVGHEESQAFWTPFMRGDKRIESRDDWGRAKVFKSSWRTCCLGAQSTEFQGSSPLNWHRNGWEYCNHEDGGLRARTTGDGREGSGPLHESVEDAVRLFNLQMEFPEAIEAERFDDAKAAWEETWEILQRLRRDSPDHEPLPEPWKEEQPLPLPIELTMPGITQAQKELER